MKRKVVPPWLISLRRNGTVTAISNSFQFLLKHYFKWIEQQGMPYSTHRSCLKIESDGLRSIHTVKIECEYFWMCCLTIKLFRARRYLRFLHAEWKRKKIYRFKTVSGQLPLINTGSHEDKKNSLCINITRQYPPRPHILTMLDQTPGPDLVEQDLVRMLDRHLWKNVKWNSYLRTVKISFSFFYTGIVCMTIDTLCCCCISLYNTNLSA